MERYSDFWITVPQYRNYPASMRIYLASIQELPSLKIGITLPQYINYHASIQEWPCLNTGITCLSIGITMPQYINYSASIQELPCLNTGMQIMAGQAAVYVLISVMFYVNICSQFLFNEPWSSTQLPLQAFISPVPVGLLLSRTALPNLLESVCNGSGWG